jgi:hypothetical protein
VWFADAPVPVRIAFPGFAQALEFAFSVFPNGATIEDLRRLLCLSVCDDVPITRLSIAKEVASRPDLYQQITRGTYAMAQEGRTAALVKWRASSAVAQRAVPVVLYEEDEPFNAESFFGGRFTFSAD